MYAMNVHVFLYVCDDSVSTPKSEPGILKAAVRVALRDKYSVFFKSQFLLF